MSNSLTTFPLTCAHYNAGDIKSNYSPTATIDKRSRSYENQLSWSQLKNENISTNFLKLHFDFNFQWWVWATTKTWIINRSEILTKNWKSKDKKTKKKFLLFISVKNALSSFKTTDHSNNTHKLLSVKNSSKNSPRTIEKEQIGKKLEIVKLAKNWSKFAQFYSISFNKNNSVLKLIKMKDNPERYKNWC